MVSVRKRKLKQRGRGTDEGTDRGTDEGTDRGTDEGTERGIRKGTGSGPGRDIFTQCPPLLNGSKGLPKATKSPVKLPKSFTHLKCLNML